MEASLGRYFSKLGGRPSIHRKTGEQPVWLTSELFAFKPVVDTSSAEIVSYVLQLGTPNLPLGQIKFTAHKDFKAAASIHISVNAGRWYVSVSFNYDDGQIEPSAQETTEYLMQFTENELAAVTVGLDRGVNLPLAGSDGQKCGFTAIHGKRLSKQESHKKRWQRRQVRRTKGSKNWHKAKHKVARYKRYGTDVRRDVPHPSPVHD